MHLTGCVTDILNVNIVHAVGKWGAFAASVYSQGGGPTSDWLLA
jgi:hypothetical protein